MAKEASNRREILTLRARDPEAGGDLEVQISYDRLQAVGARSRGQTLEAAFVLPQVLQSPVAVFEGLCSDEDEDKRGVGWRCYSGLPDRSYTQDGEQRPPRRGQVYLVFVNEDRVAYNWRWELADPDNPGLPPNHESRFRRRLVWTL